MSGYITFWSKDYVKEIEKYKDNGPFCVVYGSSHTRMPYISSLKVGDIIYPVAIREKTLCVMARLPIEVIEPAYDYLMRETGNYFDLRNSRRRYRFSGSSDCSFNRKNQSPKR